MVKFSRTAMDSTACSYAYMAPAEPSMDEVASQAKIVSRTVAKRFDGVLPAKRAFDIAVAAIALAVLFPFMLLVAIIIKLESRGPVLFVQERIGLNRRRADRRAKDVTIRHDGRSGRDRRSRPNDGRPFRIYKFRTMVQNAEAAGPALARANDPRITRLGRLMRKTRVDEIPQFINVLKGDMSIVGPRPERSYFIDKVSQKVPEFTMRLMVKPGITGLAQVEDGYTTSVDEMQGKLFYDLKYIANFSLAQEIKILLKTFYVILTGKGAC